MIEHKDNNRTVADRIRACISLIILLMMGLFDIGRAIFYYSTFNTAVREGTRFGDRPARLRLPFRSRHLRRWISGNISFELCKCDIHSKCLRFVMKLINKFFTIEILSTGSITINHTISSTDDPEINISIDYLFKPITPGCYDGGFNNTC